MNPARPVTREADLLFRCARGRPDSEALRIAAGHPDLDWSRFFALAESHHLASLACRRLESACPDLVPPRTLAALRLHFRRNAERNLFLSAELLRIVDRLHQSGVPALAFKGPVFAWWLYDHPGIREFQDLDLLLDAADVARAQAVFADLGYRSGAPEDGQVSLFRDSPPVLIDLHWELAPRSMRLAWNARSVSHRSVSVPVAGRAVPTFSPEDQVLFCALHGGKHGWTNLAWLADLSALIEVRPPDWARLLSQARGQRLTRALFVGLRLAGSLLGSPLPAGIRQALSRDTASAAIAREARAYLEHGPRGRALFPRELTYGLRLTEGWTRQCRFLWTKITEPSSEDSQLPRSTRPFRLVRKYAGRLAGSH